MEFNKKSSGVAKAGMATGIVGTTLAGLSILGQGANMMNAGVNGGNGCCCNEDHFVTRYDAEKDQRIAHLESQIALRDANTYSDQKSLELYGNLNDRLRNIENTLSAQAVRNQATADSFKMVEDRLACCCDKMEKEIESECEKRSCADNAIVSYLNSNFYTKVVADVLVDADKASSSQPTFNPLPAYNCGC